MSRLSHQYPTAFSVFDFRQKCAQCYTLKDTNFFSQFSDLDDDCETVRVCPNATNRFCVTVSVRDTEGVVKFCSTQGNGGPCQTKFQEQIQSTEIYCVSRMFCEANGCNADETCMVNSTMCGN